VFDACVISYHIVDFNRHNRLTLELTSLS